ncbi:hypothetical protein M0802_003025 [Mischocyttarus mexicanus]|nr:hypothetical protein M0802_003025 [Mischocyttarus mexicanus]
MILLLQIPCDTLHKILMENPERFWHQKLNALVNSMLQLFRASNTKGKRVAEEEDAHKCNEKVGKEYHSFEQSYDKSLTRLFWDYSTTGGIFITSPSGGVIIAWIQARSSTTENARSILEAAMAALSFVLRLAEKQLRRLALCEKTGRVS